MNNDTQKPPKIITYRHHGTVVCVQEHLKGRHAEHCLCWQDCVKFKPGMLDNCPKAALLYRLCILTGMTTPVWECPDYDEGVPAAPTDTASGLPLAPVVP